MGKLSGVSIELSKRTWKSIWCWWAAIIAVSMGASLALTELVMLRFGGMNLPGLLCATLPPLLLGGPMAIFMLVRHRQLALINERLRVLASTDGLTGCFNRRAFTALVNRRLAGAGGSSPAGALLVIDVDQFKSINDRFGHDRGDDALQRISSAIMSNVRAGDPVGRMGGEEFAAFLVGADHAVAADVATRILTAIRDLDFAPEGERCVLSVSIGGAALGPGHGFAALYRAADQRLYEAKQSGRDRVEMLGQAA